MEPGACGCKGYGKGNYGTEIPGPQLISPPQDVNTEARYDGPTTVPSCRWNGDFPKPEKVSEATVHEWMSSFKELIPSHSTPPLVGEDVLWRGFKKGKKGHQSTEVEYFNGTVHGSEYEDGELYLYVS